MRLLIMHDLSSEQYPGGAELWADKVLELCPQFGVNGKRIDMNTPTNEAIKAIQGADKILIMNEWFFSEELIDLAMSKPFFKMQLDYAFQPQRNGIGPYSKLHPKYFRQLKLMLNAQKIIFMNPKHMEFWLEAFKEHPLREKSFTINILMGELSEYKDMKRPRVPNSALFLGRLNWEKGIDNVIKWARANPGTLVFVAGFADTGNWVEQITKEPNCVYIGSVPHNLTPMVYNKFEKFLALPNWLDPGATTSVEAELCGMEVIQNENNGISSHGWKDTEELRKQILDTRTKLFEELKK